MLFGSLNYLPFFTTLNVYKSIFQYLANTQNSYSNLFLAIYALFIALYCLFGLVLVARLSAIFLNPKRDIDKFNNRVDEYLEEFSNVR